MLSSELMPLLKESIELWEANARLDVDGAHENAGLSGGTKFLQSSLEEPTCTPDGRLAVVLRIGFGTVQGQLVRTMLFGTVRISAINLKTFPPTLVLLAEGS